MHYLDTNFKVVCVNSVKRNALRVLRLSNSRWRRVYLANILNWSAMRVLRLSKKICGKLILWAISLDPSREIFKSNLASLQLNTVSSSKIQHFAFLGVIEGCKAVGAKIKLLQDNRSIKLSLPKVINNDIEISKKYICEAILPKTYIAEITNATVFSNTDLIIVNNLALYDEIDKSDINTYAIKSPIVKKISKQSVALSMPSDSSKTIPEGIHFAKDHSKNYFHWIVECIPRLSLVQSLAKNIPLLVDEDIPSQALEALELLNTDNRPIIRLKRGKAYKVKKLHYPSQLSALHDNYNKPNYKNDLIYSPEAISFVRNAMLKKINAQEKAGNRKIYISRKNSDYRQLLNTVEVENFLAGMGFEIIFPEHLSFFTQLQIFSRAEIIIGQSGAGMTNFIFAPKGCKVVMLAGYHPDVNLHGFSAVAELSGIDLKFLFGKNIQMPTAFELHADFYIDLKMLSNYLGTVYE